MTKRLAYLGPPGTFSEEAALLHDPQAEFLPLQSIAAVAAAVEAGMAGEGIIPIENSLEGSVGEALDLLIHESSLSIRRELVLPIEHCLLAPPGTTVEAIGAIFSHPHALAQCRKFIERCFPKAQMVAALSTAAAVEEMLARSDAAAIATHRAAQIYNVQALARGIQDRQANLTRFVVLADADHPPTGHDKTSIAFSFADDRPGLLVAILAEFARRSINLTKVESRPTKERLGEYIFLLDLEGHRQDPPVAEGLKAVAGQVALLKVFGSYPRYTPIS